jgi:hypothetical protein
MAKKANQRTARGEVLTGSSQETSSTLRWVALDKHVLLVAKKVRDKVWLLSIGAVDGKDYEMEAPDVAAHGSGVPSGVGDIYFQDLETEDSNEYHFPPGWFKSWSQRHQELWASGKSLYDDPRILDVEPLDWHVLLVAAFVNADEYEKSLGDNSYVHGKHEWIAYIGVVEGKDYDKEAPVVVNNGSEIPYDLAYIYFKDLMRSKDLKWLHEEQVTDFY